MDLITWISFININLCKILRRLKIYLKETIDTNNIAFPVDSSQKDHKIVSSNSKNITFKLLRRSLMFDPPCLIHANKCVESYHFTSKVKI